MSTKAQRIAWLAEFSRERRAERARVIRIACDGGDEFKPLIVHSLAVVSRPKGNALRRIMAELNAVQHGRCYICERTMGEGAAKRTLDHVVPISLGGKTHRNVALCCWRCNNIKGGHFPTPAQQTRLDEINDALRGLSPRRQSQASQTESPLAGDHADAR